MIVVWSEVGGIAHQRSLRACSGKVNHLKLKLPLPHPLCRHQSTAQMSAGRLVACRCAARYPHDGCSRRWVRSPPMRLSAAQVCSPSPTDVPAPLLSGLRPHCGWSEDQIAIRKASSREHLCCADAAHPSDCLNKSEKPAKLTTPEQPSTEARRRSDALQWLRSGHAVDVNRKPHGTRLARHGKVPLIQWVAHTPIAVIFQRLSPGTSAKRAGGAKYGWATMA
jgi:hypothetical protein